jgi:cell wall-associated NlpC family hydrolase
MAAEADSSSALDPRLHAYRADLADVRLSGQVEASRYAEGRPARVTAGLTPVRRTPQSDAAIDTFFHHGETLCVFDERDGFAWCQSDRDRYVGYVETTVLVSGGAPATIHYIANLGTYRYAEPDLRSPVIDFLPRHSPVRITEAGLLCRDTPYAGLDDGGFVPESCLSREPPRSPDHAAAAALYLGCPYLWAGRSFLGIDCSGLVQEAFRDLGVSVLRDTDMQRETIGTAVTIARIADLQRNDLIYIPGHVMIATGHGRVIHASGDGMAVRRDSLAALLRRWGYTIADLIVRRP